MKKKRTLREIATEISSVWKNISEYARPYLVAMRSLDSVNDSYGYDSGRSIVSYFLANASGWRGDDARRIKSELKAML